MHCVRIDFFDKFIKTKCLWQGGKLPPPDKSMMEIQCVKIPDRINESAYQSMLTFVPEDKVRKIARFFRREDAQRTLVAELLARTMLVRNTGVKNREISFTYNEYGKPYLEKTFDLFFNISHSGCWAVCALDTSEVGIDVEKVKDAGMDIARSFFSREEYEDLMAKEAHERVSYFFDLWALKESYIKALGKGLSEPLNSFTIRIQQEEVYCSGPSIAAPLFLRRWDLDGGYKLAVCSHRQPDHVALRQLSFDEFYAKDVCLLR